MKITLSREIIIKTKRSYDSVVDIFNSGISNKLRFFSRSLMSGQIAKGKIDIVINLPWGFSDMIKSRVKGKVYDNNNQSIIEMKVMPNPLFYGFMVIWTGLIIMALISYDYPNLINSILYISIVIIWTLIPYVLAKVKVNYDKKRLEKWLIKKINNSA